MSLRVRYIADPDEDTGRWKTHPASIRAIDYEAISNGERRVKAFITIPLHPFGMVCVFFYFKTYVIIVFILFFFLIFLQKIMHTVYFVKELSFFKEMCNNNLFFQFLIKTNNIFFIFSFFIILLL